MAEGHKTGLSALKNTRTPPPKPVNKDKDNEPIVNLESNVKLNSNGLEDKILQAIKSGDIKWLEANAITDGISDMKADIILTTAFRANDLALVEILLQKGFLPVVGGSCEKAALSKGEVWVNLLKKYVKRDIVAVVKTVEAPAIKKEVENKKSLVGKIETGKSLSISDEEFIKLKLNFEEYIKKVEEEKKIYENEKKLLEEKNISYINQLDQNNEQLEQLLKLVEDTEGELAQKRQEIENLHLEMDLHKTGRVKFQFDPHEPVEYEELLKEALLTTTGKAVQAAISDNNYQTLKTKISRIRPSKKTLGPIFTWACEKGYLDLAQTLLKCGAPIDYLENLPMTRACKNWKPDIVFWLARSGADWHFAGEYPLRCAARFGDHKACIGLWRMGASINARDGAALMEALRMGHIETVTTLISLGINVYKNEDQVIDELEQLPEIMDHINKVRDMEKTAGSLDPIILERVASKLGKDWVSRRRD